MSVHSLNEALVAAVTMGQLPEVKRLLTAGASPNAARKNEPVLTIAVDRDFQDIAVALLAAGAAVNAFDDFYFTAFHVAILKKNFYLADVLLQAGADINAQRNPGFSSAALHQAIHADVRDGGIARILYLLDRGADPKVASQLGSGFLLRSAPALEHAQELSGGDRVAYILQHWQAIRQKRAAEAARFQAQRQQQKKYRL